MAIKILGMTLEEAFEKQICISCKEDNAFETEKISYEIDGLCPKCSPRATTPSKNPLLLLLQQQMAGVREEIIKIQKVVNKSTSKPVDVRLAKLSVCSCGYSLLKEEIKLGTPYKIWVDEIIEISVYCGNCCKTRDKVQAVIASQYLDKDRLPAFLPLELFDYAAAN